MIDLSCSLCIVVVVGVCLRLCMWLPMVTIDVVFVVACGCGFMWSVGVSEHVLPLMS